MRFTRFSVLLLICALSCSGVARADTVSIGLSSGGPITIVSSAPGQTAFSGSFGSFSHVNVAGVGQSVLTPPDLLLSDTIDVSAEDRGTLRIFITDQGLMSPAGTMGFLSSFTSNLLPSGWILDTDTFVSASNALFTGVALGSDVFSAIGTNLQTEIGTAGLGPYSVTEEFIVHATGEGATNDTIDLSTVPEPSIVLMLGTGLIFCGVFSRRLRFN